MSRTTVDTKQGRGRAPLSAALLLVAVVMIGGCEMSKDGNDASSGGSAKPASAVAAPAMIDSVPQQLEAFRGKVVILDLWATWCPPCRVEIPGFIDLQTRYRDKGVEVIGVSLDPVDSRGGAGAAAVGPFMQQFGINYTIWMINNYKALGKYPLGQGYPTTYVLNRDGSVYKVYVGAQPKATFENDIKQLL
jgi:thiol-disulfide isomerase/thioredoxin